MNQLIIVDTREKPKAIEKILEYFDTNGFEYERSKLLFGDYMDYNHPDLVIDRKQNIEELAKNCTTDHERFRNELERAKKAGASLVILVEQSRYKDRDKWVDVKTIEDLMLWTSPHTTIIGEKVYRVLVSWTSKYDLRVVFCDKRKTGRKITEILYKSKIEPGGGR